MEVHKEDEALLNAEDKEFHRDHQVVEGYVPPQDPLHDINANKTVIWLVVCTLGLFLSIWVMAQLFHYMARGERDRKVRRTEGPLGAEMKKLNAQAQKELLGEDNHKSIDQAIQEYLKK